MDGHLFNVNVSDQTRAIVVYYLLQLCSQLAPNHLPVKAKAATLIQCASAPHVYVAVTTYHHSQPSAFWKRP